MLEALESGDFPELEPEPEKQSSWWDSLNPFKSESEPTEANASAGHNAEASPTPSQQPPSVPAVSANENRSFEERLRILKGLREMDLITEQEYESRRREILGEL